MSRYVQRPEAFVRVDDTLNSESSRSREIATLLTATIVLIPRWGTILL